MSCEAGEAVCAATGCASTGGTSWTIARHQMKMAANTPAPGRGASAPVRPGRFNGSPGILAFFLLIDSITANIDTGRGRQQVQSVNTACLVRKGVRQFPDHGV